MLLVVSDILWKPKTKHSEWMPLSRTMGDIKDKCRVLKFGTP
jgi:hypothetical protein